MAFELGQALSALTSQSTTVSSADERIDNFHKFILDNVPYGVVAPANLQQGLIQFDGPAQDPLNGKKPLQWYFGGVPHAIIKAIRIQYTYTKAYQGTDYDVSGSLFIGYEDVVDNLIESARGRLHEILHRQGVTHSGTDYPALIQGIGAPKARADATRAHELMTQAHDFRTELRQAREQRSKVLDQGLAVLGDLVKALRDEAANLPGTVGSLAHKADDLDTFIQSNYPYRSFLPLNWDLVLQRNAQDEPTPIRIDKDGPAQRYDSLSPFPFTLATLFSDQDKYNQLLWWYFGGRPYRITKAMRIPIGQPAGLTESLLLGFQGPGEVP